MLHGDERGLFELSFAIPAECADRLADGRADIGIVPSVELNRQKLEIIPGTGIACHGPVRSILLISKVPFERIRTLATDASSRTSVALSRIVLAKKYGVEPQLYSETPASGIDAGALRRRPDHRGCRFGLGSGRSPVPCARSGHGMDRNDGAAHGVCGVGGACGSARSRIRGRSGPRFVSVWRTWKTSCARNIRNWVFRKR